MHRVHPAIERVVPLLASLQFAAAAAQAQSSGGPYGPIDQRYEIPQAAHVYYVAPYGRAEASGSTLEDATTIEAALGRVVTGDAIVMRGGVYRTGNLELNQRVTIQPFAGERPVLKGTEVPAAWEAMPGNVWRTSWTRLFPAAPLPWWRRAREESRTPLHRFNNDMVFVDDTMLRSVGGVGELDARSYYIDYENRQVYIGVNPAGRQVEITAHDGALVVTSRSVHGRAADHRGPVIRGVTFTQYAWRALEVEGRRQFGPNDEPTDEPVGLSDPATYGKEVVGTLLENVTISFCSRVAGYFRGDSLVIRNSFISDTGTEGIYVIGSSDVLLERNIIRRNNIEPITGYYASAVKIFNQSHRVTVRDNLVLEHPNSNGVWYDVGNRDGVFVDNYVEGAQSAFMFEISRGVTVAGNVFVRSGLGVYILNSAGARVYHNTFINAPAAFARTERSAVGDLFNWHPATGPDVDQRDGHVFVNNLIVAGDTSTAPLVRFEQSPSLCARLTRPQATEVDGNTYVRLVPDSAAGPLVVWAPVAAPACVARTASLAEFRRAAPALEAHGRELSGTAASVFAVTDTGGRALREALPAGAPTPAGIRALIGGTEGTALPAGARSYPQ